MWQRGAHAADRNQEVDGERRLPVIVGHRQEAVESRAYGADVVHKDVQASVPTDRLVDQVLGAGRLGEVDSDSLHVELLAEEIELLAALERSGCHENTLLGQGSGDRQTDAPARARDNRDLAEEI